MPDVRNKVISGVVGASSSGTSIQVANLLRLFKIPQVRIDPFLAVVTLEGVEIIVSHLLSISKKGFLLLIESRIE